jgi:hypothetical protein
VPGGRLLDVRSDHANVAEPLGNLREGGDARAIDAVIVGDITRPRETKSTAEKGCSQFLPMPVTTSSTSR